jgi:hypothetical protein
MTELPGPQTVEINLLKYKLHFYEREFLLTLFNSNLLEPCFTVNVSPSTYFCEYTGEHSVYLILIPDQIDCIKDPRRE